MVDTQVFHNFALFDGKDPDVRPHSWLEVIGNSISRMGEGEPPPSSESTDLEGRTVVPGLIDAHVHLVCPFFAQIDKTNLRAILASQQQMKLNLANCIRGGVTTVRDVGAVPGMIQKLIDWVEKGKVVGPRILRANSMILPPGGCPEMVPTFPLLARLLLGGQFAERVNTPTKIRQTVRRMVARGADWIKTTHTDKALFMNRPDPPVFDDACFEALVDEARRQHRPVAMHQTRVTGFRKATQLRVNSMEHAPSDRLADEDISEMVEVGIPIVPTVSVMREFTQLDHVDSWLSTQGQTYLCPESLRQTRGVLRLYQKGITEEMARDGYYFDLAAGEFPVIMENLTRLHEAGATIGCGTDAGGGPFVVFGRLFEEIGNLVDVGLTPFEALQSATTVNARILRIDDKVGTLEPGKLADFGVLDANPLEDLTALRRVRMVVKNGAIVHQARG